MTNGGSGIITLLVSQAHKIDLFLVDISKRRIAHGGAHCFRQNVESRLEVSNEQGRFS